MMDSKDPQRAEGREEGSSSCQRKTRTRTRREENERQEVDESKRMASSLSLSLSLSLILRLRDIYQLSFPSKLVSCFMSCPESSRVEMRRDSDPESQTSL
jgi:hypothetical protein